MQALNEIHTVTVIPHHPKDPRWHTMFPRTLGYYATRGEAVSGMESYCDSETGYYTHVIIERYTPGIWALADMEEWYEWRDDKWHPIEQPEWARQVVNYAMG